MNETEKRGRYKYTESEKETLKVLKMQENDLNFLAEETSSQTRELEEIRKRVEALAKELNVSVVPKATSEDIEDIPYQITSDEIPEWDDLVTRANSEIDYDVMIEDLLTNEEFNYCIEDVKRINEEFSRKTSIWNKRDLAFLAIATGLQTARWIILQMLMGDLGETYDRNERLNHNDQSIKDEVNRQNKDFQERHKDHGHRESEKGYKSWEQIIFSSAPYDTTVGSPLFGENLEGKAHRYKTLGHDPILGWIFGPANFITDTITLSNWHSYNISRKADEICTQNTPHFHSRTTLPNIFYNTFSSVKEDYIRLPAAVFAQFVHLKSDIFTKYGLPVPLIEVFSEELAGKLYKGQYDSLCLLKDLKKVGLQAALSIIVNMIVGLVHKLFYDEEKDGSNKELYEVRTRKILLISNILASGGNVLYCAFSQDWKKLDLGGILVTLYRLVSDVRFMTKVKERFIQQEIDKSIEKELEELNRNFI